MTSKFFSVPMLSLVVSVLYCQQNDWNAVTPHTTGIGFTLISTNLERGGGGFGLEYYYTLSEEFRLGARAQYGFYGYVSARGENVQTNSLYFMSSVRFFIQDDLFVDFDVGLYREESDIMRERSGVPNNHVAHAMGAGYAINYSPKISALIGVRSFTIRGKDLDGIAEHQFMVNVGVAIRILRNDSRQ